MSVFFGVRSTKTAIQETPEEFGVFNSAAAKIFGARSAPEFIPGLRTPGISYLCILSLESWAPTDSEVRSSPTCA